MIQVLMYTNATLAIAVFATGAFMLFGMIIEMFNTENQ